MKYKVFLLMMLVSNFLVSAQQIRSERSKFGGILIVNSNTISSITLVLLENNNEIEKLNDRIAIINKLKPGIYSLFVKYNTKELIIKDIQVVADSFSIMPLYLFFYTKRDTISWIEKTNTFTNRVKMNGTKLNASLRGKVFDSVTNKPIEEASVAIKNFNWWGSKTDANGNYQINGVSPGFFTVVAEYPGAHRVEVLQVRVGQDSTSIVNFSLQPLLIPEDPIPIIWEGIIIKNSCH